MFYIEMDGEINEDIAYKTSEEAESARQKEIRDACREDATYGCYSKRREAYYWATLKVVER